MGVSIIFSKRFQFKLEESLCNPDGRYLFVKGTEGGKRYTFANIYSPNSGHDTFLQKVCDQLHQFAAATLILLGDFNVPLTLTLDSLSGTSSIPYKALRRMKLDLQSLNLHYAWRTLFPTQKD